jgi:DNA-binding NarL/FixJ family response regulator
MQREIQVVLADHDHMLRAGLRALLELEPDLRVVAEADTGEAAVCRAEKLRPQVVVMDVDIAGLNGMEATRRITAGGHPPCVLLLAATDERGCLYRAFAAGAHGHVQKTGAEELLAEAVRLVAGRHVFLSPSACKHVLHHFRAARKRGHAAPEPVLTGLEERLLRLAAQGYGAAETARVLSLDPAVAEACRRTALFKLGLGRREDLVDFAIRAGLVQAAA